MPRCTRGARPAALQTALFVNLTTHPLATAVHWWGGLGFGTVELLVVAAECVAYRGVAGLPWGRAMAIAVAANVVTAGLGVAAATLLRA